MVMVGCLFLLPMVNSALSQPVELVVRKPGVAENPTLALASFDGPEEIQQLLVQTLLRCGWFRVVEGGTASHRFILPLNAPAGTWRVAAREAISGLEGAASVRVR